MNLKLLGLCALVVVVSAKPGNDDDAYMTTDMTPTPGPEKDTVYEPGTSGAPWSNDEVDSTRRRILQMIHPNWHVKSDMLGTNKLGRMNDGTGDVTENVLMRLVFHDCIPNVDGSGGCDGCLMWH